MHKRYEIETVYVFGLGRRYRVHGETSWGFPVNHRTIRAAEQRRQELIDQDARKAA